MFTLPPFQLEMCYPSIIQSGGNYALKFSVSSDKNILHFGAIVVCLGARYKSYCSNVVRTMLVDPTETMQRTYEILSEIEDKVGNLFFWKPSHWD